MIQLVFAVHDSKAAAFMQPFFCANKAIAVRAFGNAANSKGAPIGDSPADFTLFHLGSFDDNLGQFLLLPQPENLGMAINYKKDPAS